jgi:hypothetical protein
VVNIFDVQTLARAYDSEIGDELYDVELDFDSNGVIDDQDMQHITSQYGESCE